MLSLEALGRHALGQASSATASSINAEAGSYALTGQTIVSTVTMPAEVGAFTVSSVSTGLVVTMPASAGSFALTGQDTVQRALVTLRCDPYVAYQTAQFGFAPLGALALGQGLIDTAVAVSFDLVGTEAVFNLTMPAEAGAFVVTGQSGALFLGDIISPEAGAFTLAFQPFTTTIVLPMAAGSYALTGIGQTDLTRRPPKIRRFPRVGSTTATARSRGAGVRVRAYGG